MKRSKSFHFSSLLLIIFISSKICEFEATIDEERKVYIVYMGNLPEGEYLAQSHHTNLLQEIGLGNKAIKNTLLRSYTRSFNGFAVNLTELEATKLEGMDEVVMIFKSRQLQTQTTRSWDFMGFSLDVSRNLSIESNIIIGHIDSGLIPNIESFDDHGLGDVPVKWNGVCLGGKNFTCNKKLIGARYYVGDTATDTQNHGTHTASIAVGRVIKNANYFDIVNGTARGGVPSARIATYKVCEVHCDSKDIMAAFDDAIADNVDIITISLGSMDPINISEDVIAISSFHAMQKGIITVQAVGNKGGYFTASSLAPWLFSVAASSTDRKIIDKLVLGNGLTLISNSTNLFTSSGDNKKLVYGKEIMTSNCNESSAKQCMENCIDSHLVKGKIVVCDQDQSNPFFALTARDFNASGVIFRKIETDLTELVPFPIVYLSDLDFHYVESYLKSEPLSSARILKSETIHYRAPIVASFSSKGPNKILPEIFKPDITAPGIDILAESPGFQFDDQLFSKYYIDSGTSMACPHVTGAVAYVKSMHPDWSISAIKSSLMTTAWTMNIKDNIDAELGYGAGHIDPMSAVYPGLVYETFIDEYDNMFCSMGLEGDKLKKMIGVTNKCPTGIQTSMKDVNYPAMTASVNSNSSFTIQFSRIVTNVGYANSIYHAQIISVEDSSIHIDVEPSVLSFNRTKERKQFIVTVSGQLLSTNYVSCSLIWFDGTHRVRSPILLYRSSFI